MAVGVGLDIGADSIKAVSVRMGGGGVRLLSAARVPRGPDGAFPAQAVSRALGAARIGGRVTIGVSGKDVMIRYIPVPPVPPWRLKMLVEFEIRENMAGGGADVSSDYHPLNVAGGVKQGIIVLAAVAKNAYLESRYAEARSAGVRVHAATPGCVALHRAFVASSAFKSGETTFLLDVGRDSCELAIQKDGDLLFARNTTGAAGEKITAGIDNAFGIGRDRSESYKRERAKLALAPPADGDKRQVLVHGALREAGDALVSSVNSGLRFARMQAKIQDLDFDRLILSGGGARVSGLKEFLQNRLQKPVVTFDPAAVFESSGLRGGAADAFGGGPSEMAVATGLAIIGAGGEGFDLSLVPPAEEAKRLFWGRTVFGYAAGAVAVLLAGAMAVRAHSDLSRNRARRETMETEVAALGERAREVEALQNENQNTRSDLAMLMDQARVNRAVIEFLAIQRTHCPAGLNLTRLEVVASEDPTKVAIEFGGRGANMEQGEFLEKLDAFRSALAAERIVTDASISETEAENADVDESAEIRAFRSRVEVDPWAVETKDAGAAETATTGEGEGAEGGEDDEAAGDAADEAGGGEEEAQ